MSKTSCQIDVKHTSAAAAALSFSASAAASASSSFLTANETQKINHAIILKSFFGFLVTSAFYASVTQLFAL